MAKYNELLNRARNHEQAAIARRQAAAWALTRGKMAEARIHEQAANEHEQTAAVLYDEAALETRPYASRKEARRG